jgi:hypothetical protein
MFTKQVSRPVDSLAPPSWLARRRRSSELEERPGLGPDPRFAQWPLPAYGWATPSLAPGTFAHLRTSAFAQKAPRS